MKRLIQFTLCSVALLASIAFVGCTDDIVLNPPTTGGADGDGVVFNFVVDDLNVATEDQGSSVGTKAAEIVDVPSTDIKNMWVVQFNASNTIISKEYFAEFTTTGCVNLGDGVSDIAFIANTFDEDLIGDVDGIDNITTDKILTKDSDGVEYFILCGTIKNYDPKQGATVTLRRNVARVNIVVTEKLDDSFKLNSIKIYNVPTESLCYIDPNATDSWYINSEEGATTYTLTADDLSEAADDTKGATIYLPVNELGEKESNGDSIDKVKNAPAFATYAVVEFFNGFYAHSYKFYLGADMEDDYNISANNAYFYTFKIDEEGNALSDPRVGKDLACIPMVNAEDLKRWKNNCSAEAFAGLEDDFFSFEYTVGEVQGTNWMSTQAVMDDAKPNSEGKATGAVSSHAISVNTDVSNDVLPQLQKACNSDDVRLPTQEELMYMWIFKGDNSFPSGLYWSSTVSSSYRRWCVYFANGNTLSNDASSLKYARAVREF